jgi:hypothetical protein
MIQILQKVADGEADVAKTYAGYTSFDLWDFPYESPQVTTNRLIATSFSYNGTMMGERKIVATFHSPVKIVFEIGEKILFRNNYYYLQTIPVGTRIYNSLMIEYVLTFHSVEYELGYITFQDMVLEEESEYQHAGNLEVFDYGTLKDLMDRILANTQRALPDLLTANKWGYDIHPSIDVLPETAIRLDIAVLNGYCSDALALVKSLFGYDYIVNKEMSLEEPRIIYIGYEPTQANAEGEELEFGLNLGICEINRLQNDKQIITRAFGFGSDRNLPEDYRSGEYNKFSTRLMLPGGPYPDGYIEDAAAIAKYGIREGIAPVRDDIYPSLTGMIYPDPGGPPVDEIVSVNPFVSVGGETVTVIEPGYWGPGKVPDPRYVGQHLEGGVVFWVNPNPAFNGLKGLISAETDASNSAKYETMSGGAPYVTGANGIDIGTGYDNSQTLLANFRTNTDAVRNCADYEVTENGVTYSDWFFPSGLELREMWLNKSKIGGFADDNYWSSTELTGIHDWDRARSVNFVTGVLEATKTKDDICSVRAIRAFDNTGTPPNAWHEATSKDIKTVASKTISFYVNNPGFNITDEGIVGPETAKISFTSGNMAGNEFKIIGFERHLNSDLTWTDGLYKVTIERDATNPTLMLPDELNNIEAGNKFVYLDIFLPNIYVNAAEVRLAEAVYTWFQSQLPTSEQGYSVKLTEEWVAINQGVAGLLREGNAIWIKDDELDEVGSVAILIQSISINYKIIDYLPTYDLTVSPTPITSIYNKLQKENVLTKVQMDIRNYNLARDIKNAARHQMLLQRQITTSGGELNGALVAQGTMPLKSLTIETRNTNYLLQAYLEVNYLGDANSAYGSAGVLIHKDGDVVWGGIYDTAHQTWTISDPDTFTLDPAKTYWAYIRGSTVDGSAYWVVSETKIAVHAYQDWYMFEWGQINPVVNGYRYVQTQYGINGISSYVYIAYASDDQGTNFTLVSNNSLDYIAFLSTPSLIPNPVVGDFAGLWYYRRGTSLPVNEIINNFYNYYTTVVNSASKIISGSVVWDTGLIYNSTNIFYTINGVNYLAPATTRTLSPSDPSLSRIDLFYVDIYGNLGVAEGEFAENPTSPILTPDQLEVMLVLIPAGATEPSNAGDVEKIYDENVEWTTSSTNDTDVSVDFASTDNPANGSKRISVLFDIPDTEVAVPLHYVGESVYGGVVFWINPTDPRKGLISATVDTASGQMWELTQNNSGDITGAGGRVIGAGQANTNLMLANARSAPYAVKTCNDLVLNGYSDWFMPNAGEMAVMYLQRNVIGGFGTKTYWTSSESSTIGRTDDRAIVLRFVDGSIREMDKQTTLANVRAIRAFDDSGMVNNIPVLTYTPTQTVLSFAAPDPFSLLGGILSFKLLSSMEWFNNSQLLLETWLDGVKTGTVTLSPATTMLGYNPAMAEWQLVALQMYNFSSTETTFDTLKIRFWGAWPNLIDLGIDDIRLQVNGMQIPPDVLTTPGEFGSDIDTLKLTLNSQGRVTKIEVLPIAFPEQHNPVTVAVASAAFGSIDANQELTLVEPTWSALPDKPNIPAAQVGDNTYIGLDDTTDTDYTDKAMYVPMVADTETDLTLEPTELATFLILDDTPDDYTDQAERIVKVNAAEDAVEFGIAIIKCTQAEYDALNPVDENTLYLIVNT